MKKAIRYTNTLRYTIAAFIGAFGLMTLFLSSSVTFDLFGMRGQEGHYVLFIVFANLICSIIYLLAAYGFIRLKKWTTKLLMLATIILISAFFGFCLYIIGGGLYETKTAGAMTIRIALTFLLTALSYFTVTKK